MADVKRVKLEGVAELNAALKALGDQVATKVGAKATRDAAKELQEVFATTAPFDPTEKSRRLKGGQQVDYGHLRDQMKVRKTRVRKAHTVRYQVSTGNAFWGSFLEFGTVKMAARPWMRPAFNVAAPRVLDVMIEGLREGIEREAKRAARIKRGQAILASRGR